MKITTVISTYNNQDTIDKCLDSFCNQSLDPNLYEIVIVSDGSTDNTVNIVKGYIERYPILKIKYIEQENLGAPAARNHGAKMASNDILLFSQSDIIADFELLKKHYDYHLKFSKNEDVMVGHTTWYREKMRVTPFMEWLESGGPQFDFDRISKDRVGDYLSFYTPNLSIKKLFFEMVDGFDEEFRGPSGMTAYEDTELGFRLQKAGMQIRYDQDAVAYHWHEKDLVSVLRRRVLEGQISHILIKKHPDLRWDRKLSDAQLFWLSFWLLNPIILWPVKMIAEFTQTRLRVDFLYKLVTRAYYNWGYSKGLFTKRLSVS